jgi:hypothetical protein
LGPGAASLKTTRLIPEATLAASLPCDSARATWGGILSGIATTDSNTCNTGMKIQRECYPPIDSWGPNQHEGEIRFIWIVGILIATGNSQASGMDLWTLNGPCKDGFVVQGPPSQDLGSLLGAKRGRTWMRFDKPMPTRPKKRFQNTFCSGWHDNARRCDFLQTMPPLSEWTSPPIVPVICDLLEAGRHSCENRGMPFARS